MGYTKISDKGFSKAKARPRRIRRIPFETPCAEVAKEALRDLDLVFDQSKYYEDLSAADKIGFERCALEKLLKVILLFNRHISHSLRYRLREALSEEVTSEELRPDEIEEIEKQERERQGAQRNDIKD